jgi:hypothetical protein
VEPVGFTSKLKWRLLTRWFAPDKTINKRLVSSDDDTDLGGWARFKRYLLRRWLPTIHLQDKPGNAVPMSELGEQEEERTQSAPPSLMHHQPDAINELARMSTPVVVAEAEPTAVQQMATAGLRPLGVNGKSRRTSSAPTSPRQSEDRPSSRGSSGIMIEEKNLSDSESDAGEAASTNRRADERVSSVTEVGRQ